MNKSTQFGRRGRATIIDVGRVAGVSDATVSRALNKPETVSADTRKRIDAAIAETGYVPNPLAKAMVSGRTYTIGALVPTLDHAIFSKFLNALETELSTQNYSLVVAVTEGDSAIEVQKAKKLLSMGVEGLIVSGLSHNQALLTLTNRFAVPLVATSYHEPSAPLPTIGYDNEVAAQLALKHLLTMGHRHVTVIHGPLADNDRTRARIKGLKSLDADVTLRFVETSLDYRGGSDAVTNWDQTGTAILCLSDVLAMGAVFKLQAQGARIPQDVSLIGCDDMDASEFLNPPLTTVHLPIAKMGIKTATAICDYLATGKQINHQELQPRLVVRASTAKIKR